MYFLYAHTHFLGVVLFLHHLQVSQHQIYQIDCDGYMLNLFILGLLDKAMDDFGDSVRVADYFEQIARTADC